MVRGRDGRQEHDKRHRHAEYLPATPWRLPVDRDPHQEVPADMQTRHRRVLVREGGRLQHAIGVGTLRHRIDEPWIRQEARRRHRDNHEEDQADQSGQQQRRPV